MSEINTNTEYAIGVRELCASSGVSLDLLTFFFEKKGIHGILAPANGGKTHLADILSGSEPFDSGELIIGEAVYTPSKDYEKKIKNAKKKIGYVRRGSAYYSDMTVYETMELVGSARGVDSGRLVRQIKEALSLTGLEERRKRLVKNLSVQEQKLLDIACSLLGNPDIIIINGLSMSELGFGDTDSIYKLIKFLGEMKTVIIATENWGVVKELCSDIVIMSEGRMLAAGSFSELEARLAGGGETLAGLYKALRSASLSGGKK